MNCNNEISNNLDDIKEYVHSTLIYLITDSEKIDKRELIMYLSSVDEAIEIIKEELIKFLYYLDDKIDEVYYAEANRSITNLIVSLMEDEDYE